MNRSMLLSAISSTAIVAGVALAPLAYADDMNKSDTVSHSDSMKKSNMSKSDSMKKDESDSMKKSSMSHDNGMSK